MKKSKKNIIISRSVRFSFFLFLLGVFSYILLLCSKIPFVVKDVPPINGEPVTVELMANDPNKLSNMFTFHDLSKTEYRLDCIFDKSKEVEPIAVIEKYDSLTAETSRSAVSFSAVAGGDAFSFKELIMVMPQSDAIMFYTKNIVLENLQMIRNFFLTELILFLLAMAGREFYRLVTDIFDNKSFLHKRVFGRTTSKRSMMFYLCLTIVSAFVLILVNKVPENHITSEQYTQSVNNNFFSPCDMSCSYQHITIPKASRTAKNIEWVSNEIIEFVPETFGTLSCDVGPKNITFKDIPMNEDVDISFLTRNLQSANYQEIRLFVLTTLLLFFLERSFFYFRKWMRNRAFMVK